MFRNTLTANDQYPVHDYENFSSSIQMPLSQKRQILRHFFFHFWNLDQILNILKKKMIVIATLFRKLQTVKDFFRPLSKKHRLRTPFDSQYVKGSQTLANGA